VLELEYGSALAMPIAHASELFDAWGFRATDSSYLVAVWAKVDARDDHTGSLANLRIDLLAPEVTGLHTLNGVHQELNFTQKAGATEVPSVRLYDSRCAPNRHRIRTLR
jgi:hypothetical protein